jgi:hypothetical protein
MQDTARINTIVIRFTSFSAFIMLVSNAGLSNRNSMQIYRFLSAEPE